MLSIDITNVIKNLMWIWFIPFFLVFYETVIPNIVTLFILGYSLAFFRVYHPHLKSLLVKGPHSTYKKLETNNNVFVSFVSYFTVVIIIADILLFFYTSYKLYSEPSNLLVLFQRKYIVFAIGRLILTGIISLISILILNKSQILKKHKGWRELDKRMVKFTKNLL